MFDPRLPRGGDQNIPRPSEISVVRGAPWHDAFVSGVDSRWDLETVLAAVDGAEAEVSDTWRAGFELRPAAVLCGITETEQGASVILTKRSAQMRTHKGEISFPGGRLDEGETPLEAALRESHEEIGLHPQLVRPVGELNHVATLVSTSYIVPIVGAVDRHDHLVPMTEEVDKVLYVPVHELLHPDAFREERWQLDNRQISVLFFDIPGETIWGATARMLYQFLAMLTGADASRPAE